MTRKLNIVITGALCLPAFVLLQCNQPTTIDPEPSSGGASGQGGAHRDAGLGGNGGSGATSAVNYNLDVIPSWWGTNDAPQGPETSGTPSDDANCGNTSHETVR